MNHLTLRHLRYFDALARNGHFGRAAESCAITQPALSMQIRDLEQSLGSDLFERAPGRVRLTRLGEEFAPRVRDILRAVDELDDLARAAKDHFVGRLRVGVIPTVAPYFLPQLIGTLSRAHPKLEIHARETVTPTLIRELLAGDLDTALVALPISEAALHEVVLFEESFVLVRPSSEAGARVPDREDLREMRLLLLEEGHCFRDQALSFCNMTTALPREMLDASSLSTLVQMVGAGIGVTLIPEMAVPVETRSADVDIARFKDPQPTRRIGMVWRKSTPLAAQFQDLAEVIRAAVTAQAGETQTNARGPFGDEDAAPGTGKRRAEAGVVGGDAAVPRREKETAIKV